MWGTVKAWGVVVVVAALAVGTARVDVSAQVPTDPAKQPQKQEPKQGQKQRQPPIVMDPQRAQRLYVGNDIKDHSPGHNFDRDMQEKERIDRRYEEVCRGVMDYQKIKYRSYAGGLEIPAYLFQPLEKRGPKGHAAMIWVHGGVHGNWGITMFPFVKEAVERGYVIIAPEYRGSTGYGEAFHKEIDYGGYEVDDTHTAFDYLKTLPHVDPDRIGVMGWSHGGLITLHLLMREKHQFVAGAAIVPVTNLVFRLSYKGPGYQQDFATEKRLAGLPFEKRGEYIERSPYYHVDKLQVPLLVHVATNDQDVNFVECQMLVDALRARKPDLAETKIYKDPPSGHSFSRRVNAQTLQRQDTPEQRDSWNRTWTFLEWQLRPYLDKSKTEPSER
jgi:dipeptidyl aminopeptidase/acylaminoacyl peptidase